MPHNQSVDSNATITAIVVTFNCEDLITDCLASLQWTDEIVVVDLGSHDQTLSKCSTFDVVMATHRWSPIVEPVRDYGASLATSNWIFYIDPDERIPMLLAMQLRTLVSGTPSFSAIRIPRQNMAFGRWVQHGGFWPDPQVRLGRKGVFHFSGAIHEAGQINKGTIFDLPVDPELALVHYSVPSASILLERLSRYARSHAREQFERGQKFRMGNVVAEPLKGFYTSFVVQEGYRDGQVGFFYAFCWKFLYPLLIQFYLWELDGYPNSQPNTERSKSLIAMFLHVLHYPEVRRVVVDIIEREVFVGRWIRSAIRKVRGWFRSL